MIQMISAGLIPAHCKGDIQMANTDIFEKIFTSEDSEKLTNNIYWNKNYERTYFFIKSNINIDEIDPKLISGILSINRSYKDYAIDKHNFDFSIFSVSFDTLLLKKLMEYGFVILAGKCMFDAYNQKMLNPDDISEKKIIAAQEIINAKLYDKYPIVFLEYLDDFHIPKSVYRKLHKYELRVDTDFDLIVDKCSKIHGEGWLFESTKDLYKKLYRESNPYFGFTSFALYRDNELKAGEFGCVIGNMYISYSGYYEESGAGTVQLIKMFQYLKESGFLCCNLFGGGDYKYKLGAMDINLEGYLRLFNELKTKGK